jgi:hypothetical protein
VPLDYASVEALRRSHPAWRLVAAEHAPLIVSFLHASFLVPNVRSLPEQELVAKLDDHLFHLRERYGPKEFPRTAAQYLETWSTDTHAWLRRYYAADRDEPWFDLTPATEKAIAWLQSLEARQFVGTESRLMMVFELLRQIAEGTELDVHARLAELEKRRAAIDEEIRRVRDGHVAVTRALELPVATDADTFFANLRHVGGLRAAAREREAELDNANTEASVRMRTVREEHAVVERELRSLRQRRSNIPSRVLSVREALCNALGLDDAELPFAGELLQVRDGDSAWEGAIERVLHGFGLSILVPDAHYQAVAQWVESTHLGERLVYYRVRSLRSVESESLHPDSLVRKLSIKPDSKFYAWIEGEVARRFDYACCDSLEQFRRESRALTRAGQLKGRGEHHEKDEILWTEIDHRQLGRNRVPEGIVVPTESDALQLIGKRRAAERFDTLVIQGLAAFPELREWMAKRPLELLEHESAWSRMLAVLAWVRANPRPGIYVRTMDLPGVDTKFIETHRRLLIELLDRVLPAEAIVASERTLEARYGFRTKSPTVRFRVLDPRGAIGGLTDVSVPLDQLARHPPRVRRVFVTENEVNGLAFPDLDDALVIFGLGYGVESLAALPWLRERAIHYWGDLDTHGFAMLDRLRSFLPQTRSLLMDRETLLAHRTFWGREAIKNVGPLKHLTDEEAALFDDLQHDRLGEHVRLEQERIGFGCWERAIRAVGQASES